MSRIKWLIKVPFTGNCIAGVIVLAVFFLLLKLTELDEPSSLEEQEKINEHCHFYPSLNLAKMIAMYEFIMHYMRFSSSDPC